MANERGDVTGPEVRPRTSGDNPTATILRALPPTEWTLFDGVRLPHHGVPLDVAVGPQGVFVVESRTPHRLPGRDEIRPGGVRQDVVVAATRSALSVSELSGFVPGRHVRPVLCFLGRELDPVVAGDVIVCSSRNLLAVLTHGPVVLADHHRQLVAMDLDAVLVARRAPRRRRRLLGR
jgi:hypothetical protein